MFLLLRKIWLTLTGRFRSKWKTIERFEHSYRVMPYDLDENFHMNNSRYFNYLELSRFDSMVRTGFLPYLVKNRIAVPVTNQAIVYRRSLTPFEKFKVSTRLVFWSETVICFEHTFLNSRGQLAAIALVEVRMLSRDGRTFQRALADLGLEFGIPASQASVDELSAFQEMNTRLLRRLSKEATK